MPERRSDTPRNARMGGQNAETGSVWALTIQDDYPRLVS